MQGCAKLASWTNNNGLLVNRNEFMLKTLVYDEDLTRSPDSNDRHVSANREEDDTTEQTRIVGGSREIRIKLGLPEAGAYYSYL